MTIDRSALDAAYQAEFARYKAGEISREELRAKIREIYAPLVRELIEAGPPEKVVWLGTETDMPKKAVTLYESGYISQERAAEMAGLTRSEFIDELGKHGVSPFQTTVEELAEEVERESEKMGLGTISEARNIYRVVSAAIREKLGNDWHKIDMFAGAAIRPEHKASDIKGIEVDTKTNTVYVDFKRCLYDLEIHYDPFGQLRRYLPELLQTITAERAEHMRKLIKALDDYKAGIMTRVEVAESCDCPEADVDGLVLLLEEDRKEQERMRESWKK